MLVARTPYVPGRQSVIRPDHRRHQEQRTPQSQMVLDGLFANEEAGATRRDRDYFPGKYPEYWLAR